VFGGHGFGGPHGHAFGHHGFAHRGVDHHHVGGFVGIGPYWGWDPYWYDPYAYGPYAYGPSETVPAAPPVYIEKPQAGYCPSGATYSGDVQSCTQPWLNAAPHAG
jgi:hypothetical protein